MDRDVSSLYKPSRDTQEGRQYETVTYLNRDSSTLVSTFVGDEGRRVSCVWSDRPLSKEVNQG